MNLAGYLRLHDLIVPGMLLGLMAWLAFNLTAVRYWPPIDRDIVFREIIKARASVGTRR
ncbi:MAG: hypothetical protein V3R77_08630 [Candidatus Binatia bacterium]